MNSVEPIRNKDDIQAMKDYLKEWNERNYMLFLFGINSGLRISDILQLRVKDVSGWSVRIREKKTRKEKSFRMTPTLKKEVREYVKPLSRQSAYLILKIAAEECGLESVGTHTMRKTFGYHFYNKYKDIVMLMELFNHASPAITKKYIGIKQDQQDLAMSRFGL